MTIRNKPLENIVGKAENAGNINYLYFFSHNVFYSSQTKFQIFSHFYFVVCKYFELEQA